MNDEIDDDSESFCECGKSCFGTDRDYYMLDDELWLKLNGKEDGMLCIDCVEKKLGRKLQADDIKPCHLTLFDNPYTKQIMLDAEYKLKLDDLFTFSLNIFEEKMEKIYHNYHTKRLYKFFNELSYLLDECKELIQEIDGYETEDICLCPECIFEEITILSDLYGIGRTISE